MGTLDDFKASFGDDALRPTTGDGTGPHTWYGACRCGHLGKYHNETVGGSFALRETVAKTLSNGRQFVHMQTFDGGCRGAIVDRGQQTVLDVQDNDSDPMTRNEIFLSTCPCPEFVEVAQLDRPGRFFNQRIPADRTDPLRHPMAVGIRAFSTFLSRRRRALLDPNWAIAEFERRFIWGERRCEISRCKTTGDGVWPIYVSDDGHSELRCAAHR